MRSPEWWARRRSWAAAESAQLASAPIRCRGCQRRWRVEEGDLHHCDYDRLGAELHEDLWPMCRSCHTALHTLLESFAGYRRMHRRLANELALAAMLGNTGDGVAELRSAL